MTKKRQKDTIAIYSADSRQSAAFVLKGLRRAAVSPAEESNVLFVCGYPQFYFCISRNQLESALISGMPKSKQQKQTILQTIGENLKLSKSLLFVDYKGLKVKDLLLLRKQLKELGAKLQVAKKTLLKKALQEKGIDVDLKSMEGQIAAVFSFEDAFSPIKSVAAFAKTAEALKILGGYIENQVRDSNTMKEIGSLPSKKDLLGRLVGNIASPMSGFLNVMQGNIKGLVVALNAIANKK